MAESKSVTIALSERPFNEKLRTASILEVRGEGATLRVPLDKSMAALERLELCFEKNGREGPETKSLCRAQSKAVAVLRGGL